MTAKLFWKLFTFVGVVMFVAGLVLTIVLIDETGTEQPDSACDSSMGATVHTYTCVTSDDPKVLLGVLPLMLGAGMAVLGGIKWASTAASESMGDSADPNSLLGSVQTLRESLESAANAPPPGSTPQAPPPGSPPIKS